MTSSENTKNPQVETSLFSDKKAETIKVAAELCNKKFSDFAHAKAAQKCTVGIYTTTENLEALATITTQLAALAAAPLDIQTITAFFAFIEKYGHLSSLDQLKERLAAAQFNENIATDMSVEQGIKILFLYQTLKKRNPTSGTNFQKRIHHVAPGESVTQFINRVEEKIQTGTLVTTKVITTPVPLHSEPKLQSPVNPFTERVTIKAETDDSLQVELFIQNNESIYILSLEKGSTPQLIKGKGKLQHQIKKGSILKVETENEHNLFRLTEKQTLEMVREHSQKGPETKLLKFAFDSLWKWHQFEFTSINTELIETLETAIAGFEKRENSGFYKDQVKKVLAKLELEGFPKRIAVEILDRVQGISTGGWLLEPSFFDYLEKKKNLSPEQWHKLLSVASNREDLLTLIEEWSQEGIFSPLEKMNFSNSIEQAIPGDNIEHFVQMFTTIFESTTSGTCNEKLLQYSYHCKALPTEKHPSFETFSRQVFHIISLSKHESLETSQAEAENKLRFKKQELTLRWLYAKITGSFGELHMLTLAPSPDFRSKKKCLSTLNLQPNFVMTKNKKP